MAELWSFEILGRPVASYALVAGIAVFIFAIRIIALRAVRARPRGGYCRREK